MKILFLNQRFEEGEAATEYTKTLASELVEDGHEASVVAFDDGTYYSVDERVDVRRVDLPFEGDNIYNWSMMMNNELKREAREVFEEGPDIIHAIDWGTVPGGVALSRYLEVPLITTFQSTENQRGFEGDHAGVISELEWEGAFEAEKVIATSHDTKNSLLFDLEVPEDKLTVIDPLEQDEWQKTVLNKYRQLTKQEVAAE